MTNSKKKKKHFANNWFQLNKNPKGWFRSFPPTHWLIVTHHDAPSTTSKALDLAWPPRPRFPPNTSPVRMVIVTKAKSWLSNVI